MSAVREREKSRQEYLRKRRSAHKKMLVAGGFLLIGPATIYLNLSARHRHPLWPFDLVVVAIAFAISIPLLWMEAKAAHKAAQRAYVPPITADALPNAEILVRGSTQPPVRQSEILLRATQAQQTPEEELLRIIVDGDRV